MSDERRRRILIVEDSAVMRSLLRTVISTDAHLEVAGTAADGASALAFLAGERPDLVLLDVEMPVMDGLATLRQMRSRGIRVPVIMCSSLTRRGARVTIDALASGASDYVSKPAGQASRDAAIRALSQELVPKVLALTSAIQLRVPVSSASAIATAFPARQVPVQRGDCSYGGSFDTGDRRLNRGTCRARGPAARVAGRVSVAGADRAAHARTVYPVDGRAAQQPLRPPCA
jgi:chemotaxis response regulator CheB